LNLAGAQQHTVVAGETLSTIARNFFGGLTNVGDAGPRNGFFFPVIMTASDIVIPNPDLIQPGMVLTVPNLRLNLDNPASRQAVINSLLEVADFYPVRNRPLKEEGLRRLANSL
jgi:LysM repeat protein